MRPEERNYEDCGCVKAVPEEKRMCTISMDTLNNLMEANKIIDEIDQTLFGKGATSGGPETPPQCLAGNIQDVFELSEIIKDRLRVIMKRL